jgi:hypothetical protein
MTKKSDDSEFIQGAAQLMTRLKIGPSTFKTLIEVGMPGRFHNGRWYFHAANVDRWLERWTAGSVGRGIDEREIERDDPSHGAVK